MRGEKPSSFMIIAVLSGSSPHARGKVSGFYHLLHLVRIIPACAGKSASSDLAFALV